MRFNSIAYHQQAQTVHARFERSGRAWAGLAEFAAAEQLDPRSCGSTTPTSTE
ncbi:hypothetical protein [Nocardia sp. NPDC057227]|uniref:hypothetical protein n=1 Tax=Nocardia sp. NPDC057227 TaxID=3346056 RepID=UPI00364119EB